HELGGGLALVVVKSGGVASPRSCRSIDAIGMSLALLGIEFDEFSPATAVELPFHERAGRFHGRVKQVGLLGSLVGGKQRFAHSRRSRRLQPGLRRRGLFFSLAERKVFAVAPQVAALCRDLFAEEGYGFFEGGGCLVASRRLLSAGQRNHVHGGEKREDKGRKRAFVVHGEAGGYALTI